MFTKNFKRGDRIILTDEFLKGINSNGWMSSFSVSSFSVRPYTDEFLKDLKKSSLHKTRVRVMDSLLGGMPSPGMLGYVISTTNFHDSKEEALEIVVGDVCTMLVTEDCIELFP